MVGEQAGGQVPVPGGLSVADRLHRESVPGEPPGGHLVQRGDLARVGAPQLPLQQVGEQLVVAEPGPGRVQRHDERVRLLQILQDPLAARPSRQRVGQRAGHPLQHAGPQQQPPHLLALPLQHLGQQVLGHRPLAAGELGREPVLVVVPGQRQRRQPQPGRPPLGPLVKHPQRRLAQLHPGGRQQLPRLGQTEPQVGGADLGQLAFQPQPVQPQPQVVPGGQDDPQLVGGAHHQQLQLAARLVRPQLVQVIDHQPDPVRQRRQVLQQPLGDHPPVQVRRRRQSPHQRRTWGRLAQRVSHRQPEPLRIPLAALDRHPRGPLRQARRADPRPQQGRLAAARRRRHHGHPGRRPEPLEQPGSGHDPSRTRAGKTAGAEARSLGRPHGQIIARPQPARTATPARGRSRPDQASHPSAAVPHLQFPDPPAAAVSKRHPGHQAKLRQAPFRGLVTANAPPLPSAACVGAECADVLAHRLQLSGELGERAEAHLLAEGGAGLLQRAATGRARHTLVIERHSDQASSAATGCKRRTAASPAMP